MELRHLRAFVALAEEQHFGRAADRLHLAQPALSQQLAQLERETGCRLAERTSRSFALTAAGELLLPRARRVLDEVSRAGADLRDLASGRLGRVVLGLVGTASYDLLPKVAQRARAELPEVDLVVRGEGLAPALAEAVAARTLDLAVARPVADLPAGLVVEPLRTEPLVAVLPADHPAAGPGPVDLADLADQPFVVHPGGHRSTMHEVVLAACAAAGFRPGTLVEVAETSTLVVSVAAGAGVALVPAPVQGLALEGVVYRPLRTAATVDLVLLRRDEEHPAAARVAGLLRRATTG